MKSRASATRRHIFLDCRSLGWRVESRQVPVQTKVQKDPTCDAGFESSLLFPEFFGGLRSDRWKVRPRRYQNRGICCLLTSISTQLQHGPAHPIFWSEYRIAATSGNPWSWLRCIGHQGTIAARVVPPNSEERRHRGFLS